MTAAAKIVLVVFYSWTSMATGAEMPRTYIINVRTNTIDACASAVQRARSVLMTARPRPFTVYTYGAWCSTLRRVQKAMQPGDDI